MRSTPIMPVLLALAAIAVTNCNAEAAAEARDSSGPSRGNFLFSEVSIWGEISKIFCQFIACASPCWICAGGTAEHAGAKHYTSKEKGTLAMSWGKSANKLMRTPWTHRTTRTPFNTTWTTTAWKRMSIWIFTVVRWLWAKDLLSSTLCTVCMNFSHLPCLRIPEGSQWLQALCTESCHTCINPAQSNQCGPHVPYLGHGNEIKSPNWGLGLDQSCTIVNEVCQSGNPSQECNPVVDDMYAGHACPCMSLGDLYKLEHL